MNISSNIFFLCGWLGVEKRGGGELIFWLNSGVRDVFGSDLDGAGFTPSFWARIP